MTETEVRAWIKDQPVAPDEITIGKTVYVIDFTSPRESEVRESMQYFGEGKKFKYGSGWVRYTKRGY
jgi:hypothetical protein